MSDLRSANSGSSSGALSSSSSSGARAWLRSSVGVQVSRRNAEGMQPPIHSIVVMPAALVCESMPDENCTPIGAMAHPARSASSSVNAAGSFASSTASAESGASIKLHMFGLSGLQHSAPTRTGSTPLNAVSTRTARRHSSALTSEMSLQSTSHSGEAQATAISARLSSVATALPLEPDPELALCSASARSNSA
jgi:hypothetical protein